MFRIKIGWPSAAFLGIIVAGSGLGYSIYRDHISDTANSPILLVNCEIQRTNRIQANDIVYVERGHGHIKISGDDMLGHEEIGTPDQQIAKMRPGPEYAACAIKNQQTTSLTSIEMPMLVRYNRGSIFDRSFPIANLDGGATYRFDVVNGVENVSINFMLNPRGWHATAFNPAINGRSNVRIEAGPDLETAENYDIQPAIMENQGLTPNQLCEKAPSICKSDIIIEPLPR